MMRLHTCSDSIKTSWDEFVFGSSEGTFFHLSGWKDVIERSYGYKAHYIYAEDAGKMCGVLPLFFLNNLLSGKALVSIPFGVYGGVCASSDEAKDLLVAEAKRLTRELGASYLELRNMEEEEGLPGRDLYYTFIKELPKDPNDCLEKMPRKARAAVRNGIKAGLEIETGMHLLKRVYDVYAVSVRNLGSPVFSIKYLEDLAREFSGKTDCLMVRYNGNDTAGVFSFIYKDTIMPYYGGALDEYFKLQVNNVMYLKLMEYAVKKGLRFFDFGRSKKGTGSFRFKELQGFEPRRLHYQYFLNTAKDLPDTSSLSPKVKMAVNIWKRLPVSVTKIIGPHVIRLTPP